MRRSLRYHELSKHTYESVRPNRSLVTLGSPPGRLDWSNQPSPFRHFEDASELVLPRRIPSSLGRVSDSLGHDAARDDATIDLALLAALLHHSLAISAWKESRGERWSLRCNPSSGDLHPTETYLALADGLYHYRVDTNVLEKRREGDVRDELVPGEGEAVLALATIFWREAWKYRERAYRYCALDAGHAAHGVLLAARGLGARARIVARFDEDRVRSTLALTDEVPFLLVPLGRRGEKGAKPGPPLGAPSRLSRSVHSYPAIEDVADAVKGLAESPSTPPPLRGGVARGERVKLPEPAPLDAPLAQIVRQRRSALDFDRARSVLTREQLAAILRAARAPLPIDSLLHDGLGLHVWAHAVTGLEPGLYRVADDGRSLEWITRSSRDEAGYVSLEQEIARDGALAFSITADLEACVAARGDRGYRDALVAAGAVGHALYIAAEALGFSGTGIGAFYDDDTARVLRLPAGHAPLYHFAIGAAVPDARLRPAGDAS